MSSTVEHAAPQACGNCDTPLQGHYCHACGQSVANPVRDAGHALEELFESFWHLDGRAFRTLRDLMVPARVACGYLVGHRARYIAPLRLFLVLSVLTFFVAQYTIDIGKDVVKVDARGATGNGRGNDIDTATTVAEVERRRDRELEELADAQSQLSRIPGAASGMGAAMNKVRDQARQRIAALEASGAAPSDRAMDSPPRTAASPSAGPPTAAAPASKAAGPSAASRPVVPNGIVVEDAGDWDFNGKPWDERRNPVAFGWLPGFANAWLNHQIGKAQTNVPRIRQDPNLYKNAAVGAIPSALFVLVPVFALLLKLAYLRQRRLYLEHLVVGLYSHAFLCVALLAMFVLFALEGWLTPHAPWTGAVFGVAEAGLWVWMPLYLLLMQKRVYGQGWPMTLVKYLVLGGLYFMMGLVATVVVALLSLARV